MTGFRDRLVRIQNEIAEAASRAGRSRDEVELLAVSKTHALEALREALESGVRLFAENYAQELDRKWCGWPGDTRPEFDFIGHLQTNKVKLVVGRVRLIHTVDRMRLGQAISREALSLGIVQRVLVEVHLSQEPSKQGVSPSQLPELLEGLTGLPGIAVEGLMTMPAWGAPEAVVRDTFRALRKLRDDARLQPGLEGLCHLSMGMSGDFPVAVEEGATIVRVGTALFGERG